MKIVFKSYMFYLIILIYGFLFLMPFAGQVNLFDWDEIIFAESAREMLMSGDYLNVTINFEPFWEKPPMFIWFQVLSMKVFGINEFAARFPNVICGIITLISLYLAGRKIHGKRFAMFWVMTFACAILPFFYFRTGLIDPWFNLFIFQGFTIFIFSLHAAVKRRSILLVALSAFFFGLAILTKGPVAILVFALSFLVFLIYKRGRIALTFSQVLVFAIVLIFVGSSWFLLAVLKGNLQVIRDFIAYQADLFSDDFGGHSGFPGFHFIILLFGVFPASVFAFGGITRKKEEGVARQDFRSWMSILLLCVLLLFSVVQTKLVHYSSLAYFPISFLSAWLLTKWFDRKIEIKRVQVVLMALIPLLIGAALITAVSILRYPEDFLTRYGNVLSSNIKGAISADAGWGPADYLPPLLFLSGSLIAARWIHHRDLRGVYLIHGITFIFIVISMYLYVPKVEEMVQGPAIDFYKEYSGDQEYVVTMGHKSFAHFYYGKWQPGELKISEKPLWYTPDFLSRDVYIVMLAGNAEKVLNKYPQITIIGEKKGFVFARFDSGE